MGPDFTPHCSRIREKDPNSIFGRYDLPHTRYYDQWGTLGLNLFVQLVIRPAAKKS